MAMDIVLLQKITNVKNDHREMNSSMLEMTIGEMNSSMLEMTIGGEMNSSMLEMTIGK